MGPAAQGAPGLDGGQHLGWRCDGARRVRPCKKCLFASASSAPAHLLLAPCVRRAKLEYKYLLVNDGDGSMTWSPGYNYKLDVADTERATMEVGNLLHVLTPQLCSKAVH